MAVRNPRTLPAAHVDVGATWPGVDEGMRYVDCVRHEYAHGADSPEYEDRHEEEWPAC